MTPDSLPIPWRPTLYSGLVRFILPNVVPNVTIARVGRFHPASTGPPFKTDIGRRVPVRDDAGLLLDVIVSPGFSHGIGVSWRRVAAVVDCTQGLVRGRIKHEWDQMLTLPHVSQFMD